MQDWHTYVWSILLISLRVRAYMLEHRAAMHEQRVQQEAEELRRLKQARERVLARLWKIADHTEAMP
jgi:hypothetical protein